jgi:hypothetical protein
MQKAIRKYLFMNFTLIKEFFKKSLPAVHLKVIFRKELLSISATITEPSL